MSETSSENHIGDESDDFEMIGSQDANLGSEELVQLQAWLQPTDYMAESSEFHRHLSSKAPGTGLWICDTARFQKWHESNDHGGLWIKGVPGAGKSVMAASTVEHLRSTENVPVLFFFFRHIIATNRRPRDLVRDFLAQLLPHSSRLQATISPLLEDKCSLDDLSCEQLWEYLLSGLSSLDKAYCVVDAMDEMELTPKDPFLQRLNSLATFRPKSIKILMTSRPKQYLQSGLRDASIVHISLEDDLVGKDISLFVSHRLRNVLPDQEQLRNSLVSIICERSRGLFLHARLLIDQIIPKLLSNQQLDLGLLATTLPIGLEDMYNSMLLRQAESLEIDNDIQLFLLQLVTHASRALRLNELAGALTCAFPEIVPSTTKSTARSACSPLLEILEDETVQIIHHSFTEFLLDNKRRSFSDEVVNNGINRMTPQFPVIDPFVAHKRLALICLKYLNSGWLHEQDFGDPKDGITRRDHAWWTLEKSKFQQSSFDHPFLKYAVTNWGYHCGYYEYDDTELFHAVSAFVNPENPHFQKWVQLQWVAQEYPSRFRVPSALHVAAFAGMSKYAKVLLQKGCDVDSLDADKKTPLHWACTRDHLTMVSLLLDNGANPNPEDFRGIKPLHEATRRGHADIVQLLLEAGVDPLSPKTQENHGGRLKGGEHSTKGETAVEYVCKQGHTDTLMVMLPYLQSQTLEEVMCETCRYGKFEAVKTVLDNSNVSPDSKFCGATALYLAARAPNVKCVELLLARGADAHLESKWTPKRQRCRPGAFSNYGSSPLHGLLFAWNGNDSADCERILKLLLEAGVALEQRDDCKDTPLLSLFSRHTSAPPLAVKMLLEAGASVHAVDQHRDTVLHRCLRHNSKIQFLELLLTHGADIESRGRNGDTALHAALENRSWLPPDFESYIHETIRFLVMKGARSDVKNEYQVTALEMAIDNTQFSLDIFKLLLQASPSISARKRCLWALDSRKDKDETILFIRELLATDIGLEGVDDLGKTPLLASMLHSQIVFDALAHCGARLDVTDRRGRGILHHFVASSSSSRSGERLRELAEMGLDPKIVDNTGNNLLHEAAQNYTGRALDVQFVQQLLSFGILVNATNNRGLNPAHVSMETNDILSSSREFSRTPLWEVLHKFNENFDLNAQDCDGVTLLHLAATRSEVDVIRLLNSGANPNILTNDGRNALHVACRARNSNAVAILADKESQLLSQADIHGRTPLHDACTSGRPESVYLLLRAGAKVDLRDKCGQTPLHCCTEFANEQRIWSLLHYYNAPAGQAHQDRWRSNAGRYSLSRPWYSTEWDGFTASTDNDSARIGTIVSALLAAGADPLSKTKGNKYPLDLSIARECVEMVRRLAFTAEEIKKGQEKGDFDVALRSLLNLTKKLTTITSGPIHQELIENPSTSIFWWNLNNFIDSMSENTAYLDSADNFEGTSAQDMKESFLYTVVNWGLTEVMTALGKLAQVNDGPKIGQAKYTGNLDSSKYTPSRKYILPVLYVACRRRLPSLDMIEILVDKCGVDVNARCFIYDLKDEVREPQVGGTALHILAAGAHWWCLDAMQFLARRGADIEALNENGETPLHIACSRSIQEGSGEYGEWWKPDCVRLLLELGADPNALDNSGFTCLHKAMSCPKSLQLLIDRGTDLSAGKVSPLFPAMQSRNFQALKMLLDAGADPNSIDTTGQFGVTLASGKDAKDVTVTALLYACHQGSFAKTLIESGANPYAPLNDRETLIHYVFENMDEMIIDEILECEDIIDFNARDQSRRTVLLAACNRAARVPYDFRLHQARVLGPFIAPFIRLLDYGTDALAVDNERRNALHHLLDNESIEEDTILQFVNLDVSKTLLLQKDKKGYSPFHRSLLTFRPKVCDALLTIGANIHEPDPNSYTTLHCIAKKCFTNVDKSYATPTLNYGPAYFDVLLSIWNRFLASGGSINARDRHGNTPLLSYLGAKISLIFPSAHEFIHDHIEHFDRYFGDMGIGREKVDFLARNDEGENALHVIAKTEYGRQKEYRSRLFEFIMGKGVDPLQEDEGGRSALDGAAAWERREILKLFEVGR